MKELDPVDGARAGGAPVGSANEYSNYSAKRWREKLRSLTDPRLMVLVMDTAPPFEVMTDKCDVPESDELSKAGL